MGGKAFSSISEPERGSPPWETRAPSSHIFRDDLGSYVELGRVDFGSYVELGREDDGWARLLQIGREKKWVVVVVTTSVRVVVSVTTRGELPASL